MKATSDMQVVLLPGPSRLSTLPVASVASALNVTDRQRVDGRAPGNQRSELVNCCYISISLIVEQCASALSITYLSGSGFHSRAQTSAIILAALHYSQAERGSRNSRTKHTPEWLGLFPRIGGSPVLGHPARLGIGRSRRRNHPERIEGAARISGCVSGDWTLRLVSWREILGPYRQVRDGTKSSGARSLMLAHLR